MGAINKFLHMLMPLTVSIAGTTTVMTSVWNTSPIGQAINPYLAGAVSQKAAKPTNPYLAGAVSQKAAKPTSSAPAPKCRIIDGEKYCK